MKKSRKGIVCLLIGLMLLCLSVPAYAAEGDGAASFLTVSGDLDFKEEKVSTFDAEKTISGTAPEGTQVTITVYTSGFLGRLKERDCYEVTVGRAGLFSQVISLYVGENVVALDADYGKESVEETLTVNRKKQEIKRELETMICIPGGY